MRVALPGTKKEVLNLQHDMYKYYVRMEAEDGFAAHWQRKTNEGWSY